MAKLKLISAKTLPLFTFTGIYKSWFFFGKMMLCFTGHHASFVCVAGYDICRD